MDWIGKKLGNYFIDSKLGSGGHAEVFKGRHLHLKRSVAVKIMLPHIAARSGFRERFFKEAQSADQLKHPHIVEIYDFGEEQDALYLVMELMNAGSLRNLLEGTRSKKVPAISLFTQLFLVQQAAEALSMAHEKGMIHRDIKPDNLMIHEEEKNLPEHERYTLKISDFGLVHLDEGETLTTPGTILGTPFYMSPEQCQGLELDGRSDLYSLGIVLYELVTDHLPYKMSSPAGALIQHVIHPPLPPRKIRPDLPEELETIILRCLAKSPDQRFDSAEELAWTLSNFCTTQLPTTPGRKNRYPSRLSPRKSPSGKRLPDPPSTISQLGVSFEEEPTARIKKVSNSTPKLPSVNHPADTVKEPLQALNQNFEVDSLQLEETQTQHDTLEPLQADINAAPIDEKSTAKYRSDRQKHAATDRKHRRPSWVFWLGLLGIGCLSVISLYVYRFFSASTTEEVSSASTQGNTSENVQTEAESSVDIKILRPVLVNPTEAEPGTLAFPKIRSFTVTPQSIEKGKTAQIKIEWNAESAESVTIEPNVAQTQPLIGELSIKAPGANTTFTLIAKSAKGITASASQTVTVKSITPQTSKSQKQTENIHFPTMIEDTELLTMIMEGIQVFNQGDPEKSLIYFEKALKKYPNDAYLKQYYEDSLIAVIAYHEKQGNPKKALELQKKLDKIQTHRPQKVATVLSEPMKVDSTPQDAKIFLNGTWTGKITPANLQFPVGEKCALELIKEGYIPVTQFVLIEQADSIQPVHVQLIEIQKNP